MQIPDRPTSHGFDHVLGPQEARLVATILRRAIPAEKQNQRLRDAITVLTWLADKNIIVYPDGFSFHMHVWQKWSDPDSGEGGQICDTCGLAWFEDSPAPIDCDTMDPYRLESEIL